MTKKLITAISDKNRFGKYLFGLLLFLWMIADAGAGAFDESKSIDAQAFAEPPKGCRQHAWLTYDLSRATEENMTRQVRRWAEQDTTGGFYLGMGPGSTKGLSDEYLKGSGRERQDDRGITFLSKEYFDLYARIIEAGLENGNPPIVFYDEVGYPSGMAGGILYSQYPQFGAKSLEKIEKDITGPAQVELQIPDGIIVGAVMMHLDGRELVDISNKIEGKQLRCEVPDGRWKVMGFYLDPKASLGQGRKSGYVDYLDAEAVKKYIELCYQAHYDNLKKYFGSVLQITHYDEPAMHVANGKMWTPKFNENFQKHYGFSPMKYYPALWYDIGPDTAAIRNLLWGFRAKLFSESYIKQLDDWCRAHNIMLSGHFDQEEIDNPVPVNGDLMLMFKHQEVPAIDDIWWWGRTNRAYKLVSSSGHNWDKPLFMAETYAGYRDNMSPEIVYKVAVDQATMGANFQVGALPRDKTPESDRLIGRLCYMLQHGRHVADVAILYPISSLQAAYCFGDWGDAPRAGAMEVAYAREGGIVPPEIDYIDLGELIFRGLRQDFTFLHPQVLQERCILEGKKLILNNKVNREEYSVLIIPGGKILSLETARKIKAFYDAGGTVIATRTLANKSAELGKDTEVKRIIGEIFGVLDDKPVTARFERRLDEFMVYFVNSNNAGGRAYFLPDYTPEMIQAVMQEAVPVWDVSIQEPMRQVKMGRSYDGSLTYIHKVKDGRNIYLFSNSSDKQIDTKVILRGSMDLEIWDPMNGEKRPIEQTHSKSKNGLDLTTVPLKLNPISALFYVQKS
ncbi:MAG: hypothetical protein JW715_12060 [Sedimentisphaerales bacterium]|nr:hypothetical protein [Sedimentisphaerales bacterium]